MANSNESTGDNYLAQLGQAKLNAEYEARRRGRSGVPITPSEEDQKALKAQGDAMNTEPHAGRVMHRESVEDAWWVSTSKNEDEEESEDEKKLRIYFRVNPEQYSMEIPLRQQMANTKGGPVFHMSRYPWEPRTDTMFGFGTISVTFQSGNILPIANKYYYGKFQTSAAKPNIGIPDGLKNFYDFLEIVQQDMFYVKDGTALENYRILSISTRAFPRLTLYGFFTDRVSIQESAEEPNEIQGWTAQFQIVKTIPDITRESREYVLGETWKQEMDSTDTDLEFEVL